MAALALTGCASAPQYLTVPCKAPPIARPDFPFDHANPDASIFENVRSLLADREVRKGYEGQLEAGVKACQ